MSSEEIAIRVTDVSKHYAMFERPEDRLKQMVQPRLARLVGRTPRRYFRDFAALSSISFEVKRGETVGIIGRNGCGKSTLLQIVCGTLQPTSGTVEVNGRIAALLELGAGFNPEFTGRENVFMNAAILGLSQAEIDARFDDIARFADIGIFIDQPVKTYSSGMYVRLAFAVAINVDPDILVVDEALAVGDEAFQRKCFARIEDIKDKGGTILFVSHGAQTIVQLCDRAMLLDRGEKILEGRPKTVVSQYQRLANASANGAAEIRATIIALRDAPADPAAAMRGQVEELMQAKETITSSSSTNSVALAEASAAVPNREPAVAHSLDINGFVDYFDPNLKSQSTVYLEERGARIRDVHITTLEGKPVNVIHLGRRYLIKYIAEFSEDVSNVGFGVWISTAEGLGIGGIQTGLSPSLRTKSLLKDEECKICMEFSCVMLPRVYFCTVDIWGGSERMLHKINDAIAFRVVAHDCAELTGRVDLSATLSVLKCQ